MRSGPILFVFFLLLGALCGCQGPLREPRPVTHKAAGRVVHKDGKPFTRGGVIVFQHEGTRGMNCQGTIKEEDGTFELYSLTAQHRVTGAPEGQYTVVINPKAEGHERVSWTLAKKYSITAGENDLTIVIEE
jgi:hypothetical protein